MLRFSGHKSADTGLCRKVLYTWLPVFRDVFDFLPVRRRKRHSIDRIFICIISSLRFIGKCLSSIGRDTRGFSGRGTPSSCRFPESQTNSTGNRYSFQKNNLVILQYIIVLLYFRQMINCARMGHTAKSRYFKIGWIFKEMKKCQTANILTC